MARMHSRARGKSGSKKPISKEIPSWVKHNKKEVELLVVKYAKDGKKPSQIGLVLRDEYGVPDVKLITGKSITQIMEEKKLSLEFPEDLLALMRKAVFLRKHMEENKHDYSAKRGLQLTESKIRRLVKYYKRVGKLEADWKFDPKTISMYVD